MTWRIDDRPELATGDGATTPLAGFADTLDSGPREAPAGVGDSSTPSNLVWNGCYEIEGEIGRGGMGRVMRARDRRLGRVVALKFLRNPEPGLLARFEREAAITARLQHPAIVPIYEAGRLSTGEIFYAMPLVSGSALHEAISAASNLTERSALLPRILAVADALAYAHDQHIVHRDLKPQNVILGQFGETVVIDWGLAKDLSQSAPEIASPGIDDAGGMTQSGAVLGTPHYMSPEQARGEAVDERADVYALGAMLHQVVSGEKPHLPTTDLPTTEETEGAHPAGAAPVSRVELPPDVPLELKAIIGKAMSFTPSARYRSAGDLAKDLRRFLTGQLVGAHQYSVRQRIARWLRSHRGAVRIGGLAVVALSALAGQQVYTRRQAAEQMRVAQEFGQDMERNDAISRYAALLPRHDDAGERHVIEANLATIEQRMATLGRLAEAPGRYALGRGYLVLDRPGDARRELERAWQLNFRTPDVSYALGLAFGRLYQLGLAELDQMDEAVRAQRRVELEKELRAPALAHLKDSAGARSAVPEYVEALIALHEHNNKDACKKAQAARARAPWLHEAWTLEGDAHLDDANRALAASDYSGTLADLDEAGRAYSAAADMARSSAAALRGQCHRLVVATWVLLDEERSPEEVVKQTLAACSASLVVRPGEGLVYADEASAEMTLARYRADHNGDAAATWSDTTRLADKAAEAAPDDAAVLVVAGTVDRFYAEFLGSNDQDPSARLAQAVNRARQVLALQPRNADGQILLSKALTARGDWEAERGLAAGCSYDGAAQAGERALALAPPEMASWSLFEIGFAYLGKGTWDLDNGGDAQRDLGRAAETYERILATNSTDSVALTNLCAALTLGGAAQMRGGSDPTALLTQARGICQRALAGAPNWDGSFVALSYLAYVEARWELEQAVDPSRAIEAGVAYTQRAVTIDHKSELALRNAGELELLAARWAIRQRRSPQTVLAAAQAHLVAALASRRTAAALSDLVELYRWRAEWNAARKQPFEDDVNAGLERAQAAFQVNPRCAAASLQAGALHLLRARVGAAERRELELAAARAALDSALKFDANLTRDAQPLLEETQRLAARPR